MNLTERSRHYRTLELAAIRIDVDLTALETSELEAHLAVCPACARTAAAMQTDAFALGKPLDSLPSRRVDDAIAADIAGGRRQSQRYLVLGLAALLMLALFGAMAVGAYFQRSREDLPTILLPSEPPIAIFSPRPDASPLPIAQTWETIPIEDSSTRYVSAVTFAGSDLVGVGRGACVPDFNNPTACYGAAWTAGPGQGWLPAADQPGLQMGVGQTFGVQQKIISDVASGPAGLVAIGFDFDPLRSSCAVAPCTTGPGVWRSADGRTWERAHIDLGGGIIDTFSLPVAAIAAGPQGYVMVGFAETLGPGGSPGPARATAWTSPDGVTWTRAADTAAMDVGPCFDTGETPDCGGMRAVAATANGFVAVGQAHAGRAPGPARPAAWTSPDGLNWTRVDAGLDFNGSLSGVTADGPGIVAVGTMCQPDCFGSNSGGVTASSVDGSSWSSAAVTGAPALSAVASAGEQQFAIGVMEDQGPGAPELQLWRSDDGIAWRREPGLPTVAKVSQYLGTDIAASAERVVVVASMFASGDTFQSVSYSSSPAGTIMLQRAPDNLGCEALPVSYRSVTMRIDPDAADQVWAEADDGTRLGVFWSSGFRGGTVDDPVVRGPKGEIAARDGEPIDPSGPLFHGYHLCAGPTDLYFTENPPG